MPGPYGFDDPTVGFDDLLVGFDGTPAFTPPGRPPTPPTLTDALGQGHTAIARLEVWRNSQLVTTIGRGGQYPYLLNGAINVDYSQLIRRTFSNIKITDPTGQLVPGTMLDVLAPFGTEVRPYRGIAYPGGDVFYPQGVFGLTDVVVHDGLDGRHITLSGSDRAKVVQLNAWTDAYQISAGTNVGGAIKGIVSNRLPGTDYSFVDTNATTPAVILGEQAGNDPWQDAVNLATSAGMQLYFDPVGTCTMSPVPDLTTLLGDPVWNLADDDRSIVSLIERTFTNTNTYSGALVTGETTGNAGPVRALVWDTDPASATYYLGPFGMRPQTAHYTTITTADQARAAAVGLLNLNRGSVETVTLTVVPNPSVDANQIITLQRANSKIDPNSRYVISTLTIPLEAQTAMTLVARRRAA